MKIKGKNILLISPEPWNHIFVSKHHYATHLAKRGNKVFFLNPPSTQTKLARTEFENVFSVFYEGFVKGLRFLPCFIQRYFIRKKFHQLQQLCNIKFDIIWSFDNSVFFNFSAVPKDVYCISHIVDLNQDFEFEKAAKSANLCIGVIPAIVQKFKKLNGKSFLLGHGVQDLGSNNEKTELLGNNNVKSVYAGNLQMPYIDWKILYDIAVKNSEVDFIFIGSDNHQNNPQYKKMLFQLDNVYFKSQVPSSEIISYLRSADILLLAYTDRYYQNYATPHKMLEYLLAGKMIVASWTHEYKSLADEGLILMSPSSPDLQSTFEKSLENLELYNSETFQKKRVDFAKRFSYRKQIEKVEEMISFNG